MAQKLINMAIDYEEADEQSVASAIAAHFGGSAATIQEAVDLIVASLELIEGAHIPYWSCQTHQNWMTQREENTRLYAALESHVCVCCHQATEAPVGVTGFEGGECPPLHNCGVCAATII
jgi:hypothetical protein